MQARENLKGKDVNILGVVPGGLGSPPLARRAGCRPSPGEAVVDTTLGYQRRRSVPTRQAQFTVVGTSTNTTYYFGQPTVFLTVRTCRPNFLEGQPFATAIAVTRPGAGTRQRARRCSTNADVRRDLNRPQKSGTQTVAIFNTLLWLMAAGIVATMVYLTALERARDIAVLKAMGAANGTLFGGMAVQGLALALAACVVGALVSLASRRSCRSPSRRPASAYVEVLVVGIVVGLVAALVGLRRAVHIDPALAFGRNA